VNYSEGGSLGDFLPLNSYFTLVEGARPFTLEEEDGTIKLECSDEEEEEEEEELLSLEMSSSPTPGEVS